MVGLEALQGGVDRAPDVHGGELVVVRPGIAFGGHVPVHLGGQHHLVAPAAALREPGADDLLGAALVLAPAVDVGRVEEVQARAERGVHDRVAVRLVGLRAEVHRPEDEPADLESRASELCVLHDAPANSFESTPGKHVPRTRRSRRTDRASGRRATPPGGPPVSAAQGGPHGDDDEHQHEHGRHDAVSGLRVHPSSVTAPLTGPAPRPPGPWSRLPRRADDRARTAAVARRP